MIGSNLELEYLAAQVLRSESDLILKPETLIDLNIELGALTSLGLDLELVALTKPNHELVRLGRFEP